MGGQKIETEKKKLRKGLNVIITTPGRLLYHLQNTENINFTTLKMIIIDEADLMLDLGFEKDIKECFKLIIQKCDNLNENEIELNPELFKKFKIFLISATIDNRIRKMSNYFMKGFKAIGFEKEDEKDKFMETENNCEENKEEKEKTEKIKNKAEKKEQLNTLNNYYLSSLKQQNITQYYSYINDEYRLIHLIAFLYNNLFQKAIIFVSTCDLCEFLSKIIIDIEIDINYKSEISPNPKDKSKTKTKQNLGEKFIHLFSQKTYKLHGKMKHDERKIVFNEFNEDETGILIATDVAARGLDFKNVNWVIHYDVNPDIKEYINRIGRTARIDNTGNSILFLMQNERKLLDTCFKSIKSNLYEMKNSDILMLFLKNINKNILKFKIKEDFEDKKMNEDDDIVDENEIYKKKYLFAISPLLRCIKNFIFKDKNNLILARKAFKSEVRSYVTFLKYAKDVFNVKALNLTRMSRSFGLYKESLSMKVGTEQVNIDYQTDKKEKYTQRKFLNKKIQNKLIYSEFE
jgi:ATP-dependent RNA helicase DDX31/DBP7